jgi:TATA-box binding protein (TBP) (component of TFIID and TFIIIB)
MTTTKEFVKSLIVARDAYVSDVRPSYVRITTITSLSKLDCGDVDIPVIMEKFKEPIKVGKAGSDKSFEWSRKENGFYNQVTLEYSDQYSKKSVKIFPNGSVHVTGCCNPKDCKSVLNQLCCILSKFFDKKIGYTEFRIVMINANFSVNMTLDLNKVISNMKSRGYIVSFNPETYSAVKIKFSPGPGMKQVTASIFSSGKIIITGAVTLPEIVGAYSRILDGLKQTHIKPTDQQDTFNNFMGFTFEQWKGVVSFLE